MSVLYLTQPDAVLSKKHEAFTVALKQDDGSWVKQSIPAQTVEQVVLMDNSQVTPNSEPIHSVWGYDWRKRIAILITVYRPDPDRWIDWRIRR